MTPAWATFCRFAHSCRFDRHYMNRKDAARSHLSNGLCLPLLGLGYPFDTV